MSRIGVASGGMALALSILMLATVLAAGPVGVGPRLDRPRAAVFAPDRLPDDGVFSVLDGVRWSSLAEPGEAGLSLFVPPFPPVLAPPSSGASSAPSSSPPRGGGGSSPLPPAAPPAPVSVDDRPRPTARDTDTPPPGGSTRSGADPGETAPPAPAQPRRDDDRPAEQPERIEQPARGEQPAQVEQPERAERRQPAEGPERERKGAGTDGAKGEPAAGRETRVAQSNGRDRGKSHGEHFKAESSPNGKGAADQRDRGDGDGRAHVASHPEQGEPAGGRKADATQSNDRDSGKSHDEQPKTKSSSQRPHGKGKG